jgi:phenylalanine-4-hydroxylase
MKENERWTRLVNRIDAFLPETNIEFRQGMEKIQLPRTRIPLFEEVNEKLMPLTGWQYKKAPANLSMQDFLLALADKVFYAETQIRPEDEFNFCKLPDVFHDIYGHAAMLAHKQFCDFLEELGRIAIAHSGNEWAIKGLASIYWYTAEVGVIYENEQLHFYGGSIISSVSEINTVKDPHTKITKYLPAEVIATPYNSFDTNSQYFYIDSLSELNNSLPAIIHALQFQHEASVYS